MDFEFRREFEKRKKVTHGVAFFSNGYPMTVDIEFEHDGISTEFGKEDIVNRYEETNI